MVLSTDRGIGSLSDVAIIQRLRKSRAWLEKLVTELVARRVNGIREKSDFRVEIRDATTINAPASKGTNWRIHLGFDMVSMSVTGIKLTDQHGGENFGRFPSDLDELAIGDGGYAFKSSLLAPLSSGGWVHVRTNWQNISASEENGERLKIIPWLKTINTISEKTLWINTSQGCYHLRLVAAPIPSEKAELARQKTRKRNSKKQNHVSPATIFAAGFVIVLTNLPVESFPSGLVMALYRLRWQIELAIKRQKGLMNLDCLRIKNPEAAQAFILAKLLIALLIEDMISQLTLQKPDWFDSIYRPVSLSRLTVLIYQAVCHIIAGTWHRWIFIYWDDLQRYISDPPRNRLQQLAVGRVFINYLSKLGCFSFC